MPLQSRLGFIPALLLNLNYFSLSVEVFAKIIVAILVIVWIIIQFLMEADNPIYKTRYWGLYLVFCFVVAIIATYYFLQLL